MDNRTVNLSITSWHELFRCDGNYDIQYNKNEIYLIKSNRRLLKSIRDKDWLTFARTYNGPSPKGYDKKMEKNYENFK
ncbi:DUF3380 domain-containing protein [Proteus mirabilis]|nr:DUF3380 domain-containing protein [Proteus mirabilis]